ncbi:hypothetical protein [Acidithiobacillus sp.]
MARVVRQVLGTAEWTIEAPEHAWAALRAYESDKADFADYLMGVRNHAHGCEATWTFDQRAARSPWHHLLD